MNGLIRNLIESQVGCWMGSVYAGSWVYADDFKLLAPSIQALNIMLKICLNYANEYDVIFNNKSQLIVFKAKSDNDPPPVIIINNKQVVDVDQITHLGHVIKSNIFDCDVSKCIRDLNVQVNSLLGDFKNATSQMRNYLFFKFCNSFYGSQFLPIYNNAIDDLYRAWRVAVRRVWRIPWTTHCNILPHIARVMAPEFSFAKRAIAFSNSCLKSKNKTVKKISSMARYGKHSIFGHNIRHLSAKFNLDCKVVDNQWKALISEQSDLVRVSEQIKELCYMRDTHNTGVLSMSDTKCIIDMLCTA